VPILMFATSPLNETPGQMLLRGPISTLPMITAFGATNAVSLTFGVRPSKVYNVIELTKGDFQMALRRENQES